MASARHLFGGFPGVFGQVDKTHQQGFDGMNRPCAAKESGADNGPAAFIEDLDRRRGIASGGAAAESAVAYNLSLIHIYKEAAPPPDQAHQPG